MRIARLRARRWAFAFLALTGVLLAVRLTLPAVLHAYLNRLLAHHPKYEGTVGDVEVALWRGAYKIHDVDIRKRNGRAPVPFARVPLIDVSLEGRALLRGKLVGEVALDHPQLNFVAGPREEDRQLGTAGHWWRLVEKLFPVGLDRLEAHDADIHFRNFHSEPKVDVSLRNADLAVENVQNSHSSRKKRAARIAMRGEFEGSGQMILRASLDPDATLPSFDGDLVVRGVDLRSWNDFLRAYANLDAQRGKVALYAELVAEDGEYRGYAKPFFEDVHVFDWGESLTQNPLSTAWQAIVEGLLQVFRNRSKDDVATRIPITGTARDPRGEFWPALGNAAWNAFIEGFVPKLEHSVGGKS